MIEDYKRSKYYKEIDNIVISIKEDIRMKFQIIDPSGIRIVIFKELSKSKFLKFGIKSKIYKIPLLKVR